ncbi:hypothetical protein J5J10_08365 [Ciceribacter sp. L1K23]|uniref:hypothetical protein n=1 Tax=Ciceribacter sp. L1K23 TaxID=2820276 RepID=UPI001B83F0F0|nr:hypothetical protein [Ciceribacter sp. L1K23]MBR0555695.1 hypothetical protein [Ciceribacter sp. L1K23]
MANASQTSAHSEAPAISSGFITKVAIAVVAIALLSVAISIAGQMFGDRMLLAGHTDSTETFSIRIGQDTLSLEANTLRFAGQRHSGSAERADLYFLWPEMTGYQRGERRRFDDVSLADTLIFVQLSQSTMSRDMSGRVEPIYSYLFDGPAEPGPHGLTLHRLRNDAGYANEVMYTAPRFGQSDYAVRCLIAAPDSPPSSGDCQRDIHVGRDLTVLYRFSSRRLADWERIDAAIRQHFEARLGGGAEKSSDSQ